MSLKHMISSLSRTAVESTETHYSQNILYDHTRSYLSVVLWNQRQQPTLCISSLCRINGSGKTSKPLSRLLWYCIRKVLFCLCIIMLCFARLCRSYGESRGPPALILFPHLSVYCCTSFCPCSWTFIIPNGAPSSCMHRQNTGVQETY